MELCPVLSNAEIWEGILTSIEAILLRGIRWMDPERYRRLNPRALTTPGMISQLAENVRLSPG